MNTFDERRTLHRFPSPKLDPWIFYSHGKRNRVHTFYSLSERRVHNKHIKEMVDNDIVCSMHGWLVLFNQIDHQSCQLFNPVSMTTIQLPLSTRPYDFCALSCDPNNPNCIIMLIKAERGMARCYFCRPGDVLWNEKDLVFEKMELASHYCPDNISTVGCYKGQICIFTVFENLYLLGADPPHLTLTNLRVGTISGNPANYGLRDYLVESDGELFIIRGFEIRIDAYDFLVCKLDLSEKKKRLVTIDCLGGRAFFLSSFTSGISCSAKNYGIKANTIYFTQPSDPRIFSFELQNKVLTFSLPCPNVKRNLVQAEWILSLSPNPPCKVDISAPQQVKKFTMKRPLIYVGKDLSQHPNDTTNSVAEKLSIFRDWSELPHDVLISIAENLSCVACARIAIVCKSWGSAITWVPKKFSGCPIFLHMPSSSIEVFHFMSKSSYSVHVTENPKVLRMEHAKYGWLLMTKYEGKEIFFINPLTTEKIEIPNLPEINIRGLCFTSFPTSSNCSVLGICVHACVDRTRAFVYHISRGEMEWTRVEIPEFDANVGDFEFIPYSNPVFHKGVFYWIWDCGNLFAYDPMKVEVEFLVDLRSPCRYLCISYLFESKEKLMSVWVGRHGKWVRVYELDEASMSWKEVNTLDNKVIFLSPNSSLVTEMQSLQDMIIFNRFASENQPLMYSLKTRELRVYDSEHHAIQDFCRVPEYQIKCAWIKPDVKQHTIQELNWYECGL